VARRSRRRGRSCDDSWVSGRDWPNAALPTTGILTSNLSSTGSDYRDALAAAGFELLAARDRRDFALELFAQLKQATDAGAGLPPLGLHLAMGRDALAKMHNMIANIEAGRVSRVEMIAYRP